MGVGGGGIGVKERSGGKIYTNILLALDDRSIVFTVRDMKSGEMCGFVISLKTWETFDVSIVHGFVGCTTRIKD